MTFQLANNDSNDEKQRIINLLSGFLNQRPGLEWANYGDTYYYRQDARKITQQLNDGRELLRAIEWRDSITADDLIQGFSAYSGRLELSDSGLEYCTGQYWPTEFRAAVCAVCASVLWAYFREGRDSGDDIRKAARDNFGAGIQRRWFN